MGAQSYPIFLKIKQNFTELNIAQAVESRFKQQQVVILPSSYS